MAISDAELQLYLQLAAAAGCGVLVGIFVGGLLRLRKTGQLQQALDHATTRLEETRTELAEAAAERNALRDAEQAASLRASVLETELRAARERLQETAGQLAQLQQQSDELDQRHRQLQNSHTELETRQAERDQQHAEQLQLLNENKEALKREFENLAHRIFEDKGNLVTSTSKASMESLL